MSEAARIHEYATFLRPATLPGVEVLHAQFVRHRWAPHVHDEYSVALFERGAVAFDLEGREHVVPAGYVSVIPPGYVHDGRAAAPIGYRYRAFYLAPAEATIRLGAEPERPPRHPRVVVQDRSLVRLLSRAHARLAADAEELEAHEAVIDALVALRPLLTTYGKPRARDRLRHEAARRAFDYFHDHWRDRVRLDDLAAHSGLSPFHLVHVFRVELGLPPSAYQRQLRIAQAKRMLRAGGSPAHVAVECGFYDQAHLNRHFKRFVGATPGRYAAT